MKSNTLEYYLLIVMYYCHKNENKTKRLKAVSGFNYFSGPIVKVFTTDKNDGRQHL